jgi:hypothetical protein
MKLLICLLAILSLVGCQTKGTPSPKTEIGEKALSAHETADTSKPAAQVNTLKGKVLERLDAGRYSYLHLATSSGEIWAAVFQTDVKTGDEVSVLNPMPMDGFETKTLNRKFDKIVFGTLEQTVPDSSNLTALHNAHAGVSDTAEPAPIKVQRATGPAAHTIAEIFDQKQKLKDQTVSVSGKVVKVNANIMGKTWIHLRDGTGDPASRTNDLTITTQGSVAVGETVVARGPVRVDKNLGMGYVFSVMIEDAAVSKQ